MHIYQFSLPHLYPKELVHFYDDVKHNIYLKLTKLYLFKRLMSKLLNKNIIFGKSLNVEHLSALLNNAYYC